DADVCQLVPGSGEMAILMPPYRTYKFMAGYTIRILRIIVGRFYTESYRRIWRAGDVSSAPKAHLRCGGHGCWGIGPVGTHERSGLVEHRVVCQPIFRSEHNWRYRNLGASRPLRRFFSDALFQCEVDQYLDATARVHA